MAGNELRGADEGGSAIGANHDVLSRGDGSKVAGGPGTVGELGKFSEGVGSVLVLAEPLQVTGIRPVGEVLPVWWREGTLLRVGVKLALLIASSTAWLQF